MSFIFAHSFHDFQCDQQKEGLVNNATKMDEYCKERGFTAWFETSAKENINIEDAARCLVTKVSYFVTVLCFKLGKWGRFIGSVQQ
jgi:hypothetical protein